MLAFRNHRGFSLIEVLVALLVLSFGMLGIAALFVNSLQFGGSAILRTRAVNYAEDMSDRIRVNSIAGADYVADLAATGTDNGCADTSPGGTLDAAAACSSTALAQYDVFTWKGALANAQTGLPNGNGSIARNTATAPATYTVTVQWNEQDGNTYTYVLTFQTP